MLIILMFIKASVWEFIHIQVIPYIYMYAYNENEE